MSDPAKGTKLPTEAIGEQPGRPIEQKDVPTRRVRMMMVNPADFMFLFTKGMTFRKHSVLIEGLPEDAQLIAIAADSIRNGIMLVVQSDSFDEIPIDVLPPVQRVQIQTGIINATKKKKVPRKKR